MKLSVKRKLEYAFTIEEIELSTTKKLCISIPCILPIPRPILYTQTYQVDIWQRILLKCDIQHINKTHEAVLDDIKTILTLSETCRHFKDYFDRGLTSTLLNMFWIPDIFDAFSDCCRFFAFWDHTKKYGLIMKLAVGDFIISLNLRSQYYLIRLITEIHDMINVESLQNFTPTRPNYQNYFKCCQPKEVIEKKWIHFINLIPDHIKQFPKTKIIIV